MCTRKEINDGLMSNSYIHHILIQAYQSSHFLKSSQVPPLKKTRKKHLCCYWSKEPFWKTHEIYGVNCIILEQFPHYAPSFYDYSKTCS